jgi:hypothetical protein
MAWKVDEAAHFVFVQLIEQEPGICDRCHTDCARQDKIDLAWKRISHKIKDSCMYKYIIIKTYDRIQIQSRSANAVQTK